MRLTWVHCELFLRSCAVYMKKVKFTHDTFDEKLGRIIQEFPILDVSSMLSGIVVAHTSAEPSSVPLIPLERTVRQEPLQTRPGSVEHCPTPHLSSLQRLHPPP